VQARGGDEEGSPDPHLRFPQTRISAQEADRSL
jgi:hypothetical protein